MSEIFITVTERALVARINRAMRPCANRLILFRRGHRDEVTSGRYVTIDAASHLILKWTDDLSDLAHEWGVLGASETFVDTDN